MVSIGFFKPVPVLVGSNRPAFRFVDVFWLPDIKEPTIGLVFKALYFLAKM